MYDLSYLRFYLRDKYPIVNDSMFLSYLLELDKLNDNGSEEASEESDIHSESTGGS